MTPVLHVALGLVEDGGRWLISLRAPGRVFAGLWEFPGGKIGPGESPEQAAVREVGEETGLTVEPIHRLGEIRTRQGERELVLHLVRCRRVSGEPKARDAAVAEVRWASPLELARLPMPPANEAIIRRLHSD